MLVGYARTSTSDQVAGLDAQLAELKAAGVERCYSEYASALAPSREQWSACKAWVREGDTLIVTKPDRLARSVVELLTMEAELRERGVGLKVLSLNLDTSTATGRLTLSVLGAVSEWERSMMLERQKAGIAAAKLAGKYKGRPPKLAKLAPEIRQMSASGMNQAAIALAIGCHQSTVSRALKGGGNAGS